MPALYHFSEDPTIGAFIPRRAPTSSRDEEFVWAIDEWHAPMYLFPRDCPRACFWPVPETSPADRARWFATVPARIVIAVESEWLDRIRTTSLYRYTMPEQPFELLDSTAGHWVAQETVVPLCMEPLGDLLAALAASDVELRLTPSIILLWRIVIRSTLAYSGTRLRNAKDFELLGVTP